MTEPLRRNGTDWVLDGRDKRVRLHDLERIPAALQSALSLARAD